jgi:hypothetical protein
MSEMLSSMAEIGVIIAAAGTPFLILAAWKLHESVTQLQELRSAKAVIDQINAFESLAQRRQATLSLQAQTAEERIQMIHMVCERHDYLAALSDVRRASVEVRSLMFVEGDSRDQKQRRQVLTRLSSAVGFEESEEGWNVLSEYERMLWSQVERLTTPLSTR